MLAAWIFGLWAWAQVSEGQSNPPTHVYGTGSAGIIELYTPSQVVEAGGGGSGAGAGLSDNLPKALGTAAAGAGTEASRDDHVHPAPTPPEIPQPSDATPEPPGSASAGVATTWSRGDHKHAPTAIPPPPAVPSASNAVPQIESGTGAAGVSTAWSRGDHVHPESGGGGTSGAGRTAYKFFDQQILDVTVPASTRITGNNPYTLVMLANRTYSGGLVTGPFHTQYEGAFVFTPATQGDFTFTVRVIHTFPSISKSLASDRIEHIRIGRAGAEIRLSDFSGITNLQKGTVRATDGSDIVITDALLAGAVQIRIELIIGAASPETIDEVTEIAPRVSFWQLENTAVLDLSDATPKAPASTAAAGASESASRGDHVHPLPASDLPSLPSGLSNHWLRGRSTGASWQPGEIVPHYSSGNKDDCLRINALGTGMTWVDCPQPTVPQPASATPKVESGSGAVGSGTAYARDDHVHPAAGGGGTATPLSDQTPKEVATQGNAGSGTAASRDDHVHAGRPIPSPATTVPAHDGVASAGSATAYSRGDHVHPYPWPAVTGNKGKVLTVNEAENGVEWAAGGGGGSSGGGGGAEWEDVITFADSNDSAFRTIQTYTISDAQATALAAAINDATAFAVAVRFDSNANGRVGCIWPKPVSTVTNQTFEFICTTRWVNAANTQYFDSDLEIKLQANNASPGGTTISEFVLLRDPDTLAKNTVKNLRVSVLKISGGGGGSSGPSIPSPTAAGAGQYLRVNQAGSAYELGTNLDAKDAGLGDAIGDLQQATQDLTVGTVPTPWATSTVSGAGVVVGTCSLTAAPSAGYAVTVTRPQAGWAANSCIFARLPRGADRTTYRTVESGGSFELIDPGGNWRARTTTPADAQHDYWLVDTVSPQDATITLQRGGNIQRTAYHGNVPTLERYIDDNSTKLGIIEGGPAGTGAPGLHNVWTINQCAGTGDERTCDASWQPLPSSQKGTVRTLVHHFTSAANANTHAASQFNRFTHGNIIAGDAWDEYIIIARHLAGNPQNLNIIQCRIPGIQGDWAASNSAPVVLKGTAGSGCSLTVPPDGNVTVAWTPPLGGQRILGDSVRLYGVDWQ